MSAALPPPLPIDDALPALRDAVAGRGMAVLQAPPGAGKTTRVPLDLLASRLITGRIVMLEPRRLAARAAAERMAASLGEAVGQTVGYRIRGEAKVSRATRIEVEVVMTPPSFRSRPCRRSPAGRFDIAPVRPKPGGGPAG